MVAVSERGYFHWIDWMVFALMLLVSAAAGLWHFRRAQKSSTQDYLLGGKSLGLFPVSASLVASFISGVTILGTPAEIYNFGTQYWITIISILFSGIVVATVYLPVFTTLQLNSVYEYLEIRFSRPVRILISSIFVFDVILYQSIVVYVPALALNQVSGINIHLIGTIVCVVCVFYTVLGGIRAVVWTDALQVGVMIAGAISVAALGTYQMGGVSEIWNRAIDADRIEFFNFDPSPYTRHTVWTVLIGSWLYSTAYIAVNQTMVQRYKSLKSTKISQLSIAIFTVSIMLFISICCWCGLVLLAWWSPPKCDPRASGLITADDQLLPAYVMEIAHHLHGIPGLFISGIFGAALSSLSVGFNSTSVVILEDFVKGCFKMKPNDRCSTIFVKTLVVLFGLLAMCLLFLIEKLGGVLAVTNSLAAIAAGTSFGVFTLGILFPWANSKGAFIGAIAGFMMSGWVSFGANAAIASGLVVPKKLPVAQCAGNVSQHFLKQFEWPNEDDVFPLYRLSYHWVAPIGTLVVLVVGGIVTWMTGARDPSSIDKDLLSPVIHRWLPRQKYQAEVDGSPGSVATDLQVSANLLSVMHRKSQPDIL
ncbi:sodium-coupled monocarboxylate transporter 1-like [Temnothorax curvispinosus]|uniref:Sodium-coupled monocarboxylate transporter 1-like n=2 Tax=Temnothorax TaxID=300110 RepID=A0A6J1RBR4_9HYME|nr:sodium-coupled monocarboxylate transporter 1-like [Temnothorax curvispinosus]XP_024892431.1 sodium-coupled monocarboxylate transporter 1-like [Temnothorax curvispinosus]XP_024892432.1 sodium-coupled monocarboxylate transporter 1-like [Temnothorax curvispinosus]XP_024892433.1 sodium-coupled monocarboxylate transporter 1-like [Temnothorax curvispinosus]XP_024892434.1 sodium-coupled monocarboxylate transporter 1-like [Temnothorax curvispinosus]TGZ50822.1 Sodium-coupled monocarboxylate transpor